MYRLYLYNDLHNGDQITNRALVMELLRHERLILVLGTHRNRSYIFDDLPVQQVIVDKDEPSYPQYSLREACPSGFVPVNTWCGTYPDIDKAGYHNWRTIADTFNRQMGEHNIHLRVPRLDAPMIDFRIPNPYAVRGRAIYVENGDTRGGHSTYNFDMWGLATFFPEFTFYCTANAYCSEPNVVDCSSLNLVQLSMLSNHCEAIVGKGSGPFLTTYTEPNRCKPRAVMGFTAPPFWEYHGNPLQYLNNTTELHAFLKAVKEQRPTIL